MTEQAKQSAKIIKQRMLGRQPKLGLVLGSGLGKLVENMTDVIEIPYGELPGFPITTVKGHGHALVLGYLNGLPVACCHGRSHLYEGHSYEVVKTYVRALKLIGCEYFVAFNAAGSLQPAMVPGSLMLITDHINFQPGNPLVGVNEEEFGTRFPALDEPYDVSLRKIFLKSATELKIPLHQGTYIAVLGPSYETAAEIRAFRTLGADAVGMSTVPEVIVARHCGLRVAAISTLTNYGTGLTTTPHSHEAVVAQAEQATMNLSQLVNQFCGYLKSEN